MRRSLLLCLLPLLLGCASVDPRTVDPLVTPTPQTFSQWAISAESSSQFSIPDWSVKRVLGAPEVTTCSDDSRAWASARGNGVEWLFLTFARPVFATEVRVHQNFGRGAVSRISLVDVEGNVIEIWEDQDASGPCPGVLSVLAPLLDVRVSGVRVDLDESRTGFWNEIDAVALIGVQ